MPDLSSSTWSETDASNDAPPPNGWPEGQSPSSVNDCARMMMGAVKRFWDRINGTSAAGGAGNALTLTYAVAPTAYAVGEVYSFKATAANTGAATLNVNGLGPKSICKPGPAGPTPLTGGEIQAGQIVTAVYDGAQFAMTSPMATPNNLAVTDAANTFTADQTIQSSDAGPGTGPLLTLDRASASPAANDALGNVVLSGRDSGGNVTTYAYLRSFLLDPTNGSEDADMRLGTVVAGNATDRIIVGQGVVVGSAVDKGIGTLNVQNGFYKNGTAISGLVAGTAATMNPIALNSRVQSTHGLGAKPDRVQVYLECLTAESGYAVGDRIFVEGSSFVLSGATVIFTTSANSTTLTVVVSNNSLPGIAPNSPTPGTVSTSIAAANWKIVATPYRYI